MTIEDSIAVWRAGCPATVDLLRSLSDEDWGRPTDLPGWDVKDVGAHLAALESELAGDPALAADVAPAEHLRTPMQWYTEAGVLARRGRSAAEVVDEFDNAWRRRAAELDSGPLPDPGAVATRTPGNIGWTWETLLSNRALDVWVHEQDVRRAVGRPGGMDGPGARHVLGVFAKALPYVVGKKVRPPAGTALRLEVTGPVEWAQTVIVAEDGRARPGDADPAVTVRMDTETFTVLGAGRREPGACRFEIIGDADLGTRLVAALNVTP